uniref:H15 domain-containing protein n=1 Tax=Malurus cyaneus samueli TaxID=2593467 RepID=A0A8C5X9B3_9PASS
MGTGSVWAPYSGLAPCAPTTSVGSCNPSTPTPPAAGRHLLSRYRAQHPPTLQMVKEALRAHDEKKGASVIAIKRFILAKYPSVDPIRLKYLLKQALSKGLSCGDLVRPHNSSAVGATGTFKVSRELLEPGLGSDRAKHPQAADWPQAHGPGLSGPPKHRQKGHSAPSTALAADTAGGAQSQSSAGAGLKKPQKAPRGKNKGKVARGAQQDGPKAQGGQDPSGKARVTPGAGQGKARVKKAAPGSCL